MKRISNLDLLKTSIGSKRNYVKELAGVDLAETQADMSKLEEVITDIKRKEKRPLKNKVMDAFDKDEIYGLFNPGKLGKLPTFIPVWPSVVNGKVVGVANLTFFGRENDERINISQKTLFGLLLSAFVTKSMHDPKTVKSMLASNAFLTGSAIIYSRLFSKILDKEFALSANPLVMDKVRFLTAKFYLLGVLEVSDNGQVDAIAGKALTSTSLDLIKGSITSVGKDDFKSIEDFISALKKEIPRMEKLRYTDLIVTMTKLVGASGLLCLEYAPAFISNILFVLVDANINNSFFIENLLEKEGPKLYLELDRIL